jgi:hypothetical protein
MILRELEGPHGARACGPGAMDQRRNNKTIIAGPYLLSSDNYKWFVCNWMRERDRGALLEVEGRSKALSWTDHSLKANFMKSILERNVPIR